MHSDSLLGLHIKCHVLCRVGIAPPVHAAVCVINFAIFMAAMVMEKSPPPFINPYDLSKRKDKDDWILHTLAIKGDS